MLILDIVEGRSTIIMRQGDGSEIRLARVGTIAVNLVWSPTQAVIITILPDCPAASPAAENVRTSRIRVSLRRFKHYRRGEIVRGGTEWMKP